MLPAATGFRIRFESESTAVFGSKHHVYGPVAPLKSSQAWKLLRCCNAPVQLSQLHSAAFSPFELRRAAQLYKSHSSMYTYYDRPPFFQLYPVEIKMRLQLCEVPSKCDVEVGRPTRGRRWAAVFPSGRDWQAWLQLAEVSATYCQVLGCRGWIAHGWEKL